jgi:D-arabinose 1-dehydrogenase-like Zn-dependent alcohol dehydrogenase
MEKKPDVRNDVGHRMYPIQKVDEAYERVVNSDVRHRFVIDVKSRGSSRRRRGTQFDMVFA